MQTLYHDPVTKPPCQDHPPLSPSLCVFQGSWHFCSPTSQVCSDPGLEALPSFWGMLPPDLWRAASISNQMPIFHEAFLNHPENGHVTTLSYIILLMAPINAIILLMVHESISVAFTVSPSYSVSQLGVILPPPPGHLAMSKRHSGWSKMGEEWGITNGTHR